MEDRAAKEAMFRYHLNEVFKTIESDQRFLNMFLQQLNNHSNIHVEVAGPTHDFAKSYALCPGTVRYCTHESEVLEDYNTWARNNGYIQLNEERLLKVLSDYGVRHRIVESPNGPVRFYFMVKMHGK